MTATIPTPPSRTRLSSRAGDELRERIVRGDWKPGQRLPAERQLSHQLGMSRASLREAIRSLEAMGLVDVRHGQGVFVRDGGDDASAPSFASWSAEHRYSIGELLAFRLLVEPELAALAAEHADVAFVDELVHTMDMMERAAAASDLAALVQGDTAFHEAITRRAGNKLYSDLLSHVGQLLIDSRRISLGVPGRGAQVVAAHNSIVAAIRSDDADGAWTAMRTHLEKFAADMRIRPIGY
jgi:GntR family transcriptional repressor for pyruvate dehydrogenase complex